MRRCPPPCALTVAPPSANVPPPPAPRVDTTTTRSLSSYHPPGGVFPGREHAVERAAQLLLGGAHGGGGGDAAAAHAHRGAPARIPAGGAAVDGLPLQQPPQRDPCRRDGPRQDRAGDGAGGVPDGVEEQLRPAPDHRAQRGGGELEERDPHLAAQDHARVLPREQGAARPRLPLRGIHANSRKRANELNSSTLRWYSASTRVPRQVRVEPFEGGSRVCLFEVPSFDPDLLRRAARRSLRCGSPHAPRVSLPPRLLYRTS
eukprot:1195790-Prorocentrum_minimum.AAC.5